MIRDLVVKNRSYRRFDERSPIEIGVLRDLVDLARLSASAANLQPLRYILSNTPARNKLIFPHLAWAMYLKDWPGPKEGERPSAYIVVLGDTTVTKSFGCDYGIAAQSILLGAVERGLGGCMIAAIQRSQLREALKIPKRYEIILVIALGKPDEDVKIEEIDPGDRIEYWRDEEGGHHVPKRKLDDIILS
ncbi:MAG TPA: nitroreductase family protein [Deltaproteobacteria bacterium]|jgi:nitroreductase|nr:nitroreductase family protein [Deltaproteobacteria bacterium]HQI00369.1 nitroreductase family protein [Deltaproteobacteria bacterium]HQJ09492.1 nitroreductase family protein [Deltaproteobacteria bacterium]